MGLTEAILSLIYADKFELHNILFQEFIAISIILLNSEIDEIQEQFVKEILSNKRYDDLFNNMCLAISDIVFIYKEHPEILNNRQSNLFIAKKNYEVFNEDFEIHIIEFIGLIYGINNIELQEFLSKHKIIKDGYNITGQITNYLRICYSSINDYDKCEKEYEKKAQSRKFDQFEKVFNSLMNLLRVSARFDQEDVIKSEFLQFASDIIAFNTINKEDNDSYEMIIPLDRKSVV